MHGDPVDTTTQDLISMIAEFWRVAPDSLTPSTRVNLDLGIDGDDAEELLAAVSARFHTDLQTFPFTSFFGPEAGWNPFAWFYLTFVARDRRLQPLTIEALADAVRTGRWDAVVPRRERPWYLEGA